MNLDEMSWSALRSLVDDLQRKLSTADRAIDKQVGKLNRQAREIEELKAYCADNTVPLPGEEIEFRVNEGDSWRSGQFVRWDSELGIGINYTKATVDGALQVDVYLGRRVRSVDPDLISKEVAGRSLRVSSASSISTAMIAKCLSLCTLSWENASAKLLSSQPLTTWSLAPILNGSPQPQSKESE